MRWDNQIPGLKIEISQYFYPGTGFSDQAIMIFLHKTIVITLRLPFIYTDILILVINPPHCTISNKTIRFAGIFRPYLVVCVILSNFFGLDFK